MNSCTKTPKIRASGLGSLDIREHLTVAVTQFGVAVDAELDAADVHFVSDIRRDDLEHHGVADLAGCLEGFVLRFGEAILKHREAVRFEDIVRFGLQEQRASLALGARDRLSSLFDLYVREDSVLSARAVDPFAIAGHGGESPCRALRKAVVRDVRFF
jgi:hypothetical protein